MTAVPKNLLGLDVGTKRIGVSVARGGVKLAVPLDTVSVDGQEVKKIVRLYNEENAELCVVGLPRNQSGEETEQTRFTKQFAQKLEKPSLNITWQDESLTSVRAKDEIGNKSTEKGQVDALAATYILQDYLENL